MNDLHRDTDLNIALCVVHACIIHVLDNTALVVRTHADQCEIHSFSLNPIFVTRKRDYSSSRRVMCGRIARSYGSSVVSIASECVLSLARVLAVQI
jgi:hypothetical protein